MRSPDSFRLRCDSAPAQTPPATAPPPASDILRAPRSFPGSSPTHYSADLLSVPVGKAPALRPLFFVAGPHTPAPKAPPDRPAAPLPLSGEIRPPRADLPRPRAPPMPPMPARSHASTRARQHSPETPLAARQPARALRGGAAAEHSGNAVSDDR